MNLHTVPVFRMKRGSFIIFYHSDYFTLPTQGVTVGFDITNTDCVLDL